jgi:hypothetical protein
MYALAVSHAQAHTSCGTLVLMLGCNLQGQKYAMEAVSVEAKAAPGISQSLKGTRSVPNCQCICAPPSVRRGVSVTVCAFARRFAVYVCVSASCCVSLHIVSVSVCAYAWLLPEICSLQVYVREWYL